MRHQKVLRRGVERCALRPPDTAIRCEFRDGGCLEATQVYKYLSRVGEMWYDRCLGSVPTGSGYYQIVTSELDMPDREGMDE